MFYRLNQLMLKHHSMIVELVDMISFFHYLFFPLSYSSSHTVSTTVEQYDKMISILLYFFSCLAKCFFFADMKSTSVRNANRCC